MVSRMAAPQAATSGVLSCTLGVSGRAWLGIPLGLQLPVTGSGWGGSRVWGAPPGGDLTTPQHHRDLLLAATPAGALA